MSTPYSRRPEWGGGNEGGPDLCEAPAGHSPCRATARWRSSTAASRALWRGHSTRPHGVSDLVVLSDTGLLRRFKGEVVDRQDPRARSAWLAELDAGSGISLAPASGLLAAGALVTQTSVLPDDSAGGKPRRRRRTTPTARS